MSFDAFSPITTSRQLDWPKGHRIYTTTRTVPAEYPIPLVGSLMAVQLGVGHPYAANVIIDVSDAPTPDGQLRLSIDHTSVPNGTFTKYQTVTFQFPPIYPNDTAFFPGGSMRRPRSVLGKIEYQYSRTPEAWMDEAAIWDFTDPATGPFEVESLLAKAASENFIDGDGESGMVGDYLNQVFIAQDTVHPAITISAPGDLYYEIDASRPPIATYAQWVADKTLIMVSRTVDDWYGDILMKRTVKVRAQ